jgi:4-hydroxy-3-methylbut-2-enyl diphosphate reductase
MEVRLAEHFGMCFGVRDAIKLALELAHDKPITVLGDLVHNPDVVQEMEAAGAARAQAKNEIRTPRVLLTAHGTSERVKREITGLGLEVHDAVCPLVTRVHLAIAKLVAEGRHPVIIGQDGHVEVRGLVGDLGEYTVVGGEQDLDKLAGYARLGVVAQTTQPLEHVLEIVSAIRGRYPNANIRFIDTVCQPTKDRQTALRRLAAECDVVVVVGGPESNNSHKLTELAQRLGKRSYQVSRATELKEDWFRGVQVVGLTAGTSTPDHIIDEVRRYLEAMAEIPVET